MSTSDSVDRPTTGKLRDLEKLAQAALGDAPVQIRYLLGLIKVSRFEDAWRHARLRAEAFAAPIFEAAQAPYTLSVVAAPASIWIDKGVVRLLGAPRGEQGRATIGRLPVTDVAIPSPRVAGRHCTVRHTGGMSFILEDLKSANGTWIGGQRVPSHELVDGARFSPGTPEIVIELTLGWDGEPWPTPPAPMVETLVAKLDRAL